MTRVLVNNYDEQLKQAIRNNSNLVIYDEFVTIIGWKQFIKEINIDDIEELCVNKVKKK